MRAAPAALATVLVLSGFRTGGAEPCPPRAALDGDKLAVERVARELKRLGVTVTSGEGTSGEGTVSSRDGDDGRDGRCAIVRAQVALEDGGGIAVAVHGATRGSEGRVVSDAALAAAWIDSWTRSDIDSALWAAAPPSTTVAATPGVLLATPAGTTTAPRVALADPASNVRAPSDLPADAAASSAVSRWDRFAVAVDYEQTWSDDDASWRGVTGSACVMVGGLCIGGRVRAAFDAARLYNSTAVARNDVSVLATASRPVAVGRMTIAPEVGVGLGRLATRRAEEGCEPAMPEMCNPMEPNCVPQPAGMCAPTDPGTGSTTPKLYVGDNFTAATYTPRIALALRVALPLFEHVWLDGLAGVTYAPFSHDGAFATGMDPTGMNTAGEAYALPGEPTSGYVVGVGIRVGAK